jgi:hypothetical protein
MGLYKKVVPPKLEPIKEKVKELTPLKVPSWTKDLDAMRIALEEQNKNMKEYIEASNKKLDVLIKKDEEVHKIVEPDKPIEPEK